MDVPSAGGGVPGGVRRAPRSAGDGGVQAHGRGDALQRCEQCGGGGAAGEGGGAGQHGSHARRGTRTHGRCANTLQP
eukprot:6848889-Pyramimonas_sp.AAC.1